MFRKIHCVSSGSTTVLRQMPPHTQPAKRRACVTATLVGATVPLNVLNVNDTNSKIAEFSSNFDHFLFFQRQIKNNVVICIVCTTLCRRFHLILCKLRTVYINGRQYNDTLPPLILGHRRARNCKAHAVAIYF